MSILVGDDLKSFCDLNVIGNAKIGPASIDLTLCKKIILVEPNSNSGIIDPKKKQIGQSFEIGESGFVLQPGRLYLGSTNEIVHMGHCSGFFTGRSSWARIGVTVELSAGFIDPGFNGTITAEITVVHPTIIYKNSRLFQLIVFDTNGNGISLYNSKKYQDQLGPKISCVDIDF